MKLLSGLLKLVGACTLVYFLVVFINSDKPLDATFASQMERVTKVKSDLGTSIAKTVRPAIDGLCNS